MEGEREEEEKELEEDAVRGRGERGTRRKMGG